ncbi:MAG: hypothetical protein WCQ50_13645, partial [Spirochaetota bacterium]
MLASLWGLVGVGAWGTAYTWNGGGDGGTWTLPANWGVGSGYPGSAATSDTAAFPVSPTIPLVGTSGLPFTVTSMTVSTGVTVTLGANLTQLGTLSLQGTGTLIQGGFALTATTLNLGNATGAASIANTGTLTVSGTTTLNVGAGNSVSLNYASNNLGTVVTTSALNVTLVDASGIILGASTVSGALSVTAGGSITQSGTGLVVTSTSSFVSTAGAVTLGTAGNKFTGAVSMSFAAASSISAATTAVTLGTIVGSGIATFSATPAASLSIGSGGSISMGTGTIALSPTSGDVTIAGPVSGSGALTVNPTAGSIYLDYPVTATPASVVSMINVNVTFSRPVILMEDSQVQVLTQTATRIITFSSTVNGTSPGGQALTAISSTGAFGNVRFSNTVGQTVSLKSLTATTGTGAAAIYLTGNITTSGAQSYSGTVSIRATTTLATTDSNVSFSSTIVASATLRNLSISTGLGKISIGGVATAITVLNRLSVTSTNPDPDALTIRSVTTVSTQTYTGNVTLGATATLTTTNSAVSITGTLNGTTAGTQGLTVSAG